MGVVVERHLPNNETIHFMDMFFNRFESMRYSFRFLPVQSPSPVISKKRYTPVLGRGSCYKLSESESLSVHLDPLMELRHIISKLNLDTSPVGPNGEGDLPAL